MLDILLAEKGGMRKVLNTLCCFYIPDNHKNISNIIDHMHQAVHEPPSADSSWATWFGSLFGEWGAWLITNIIPVVVVALLVLLLAPSLILFCSSAIQLVIAGQIRGYQMMCINPDDLPDWPPTSDVDYTPPFDKEDNTDL